MTSWFGSGNDTAGRLKAFIKDHLGVSESASFDSQASVDADAHPFDIDSSSRHGVDRQDTVIHVVNRQDTVIHADVRPKVPPPAAAPPAAAPPATAPLAAAPPAAAPPAAAPPAQFAPLVRTSAPPARPPPPPARPSAPPARSPAPPARVQPPPAAKQVPIHPSVCLPVRDARSYDFRLTDTQFNVNYRRVPEYTQPVQTNYQDFESHHQDPQLSPPLKAISRRLEKQTTWDRGKDYLASMSDSDSDQSLSSHDTGAAQSSQYSSAESRAYFKTFNTEKFNEQQHKTVKVKGSSRSQITVSSNDKPSHQGGGDLQRHSSQARPLVIPDRTDPDDGYGSVENSSSGTASSDSSSPSNTPEQVSPGGDAMAVVKRREAFRKSTKKKATPSVQEKLRKLCAVSQSYSVRERENQEPQPNISVPTKSDIEKCFNCGKEKGVPHLLHMYDAASVCLCDTASTSHQYGEEAKNHEISSEKIFSQNAHASVPSEGNINVKPILPPLPNRTKLQGPAPDNISSAKVSFRFASANTGNSSPSVPLKADHGIAVPTSLRTNEKHDSQGTNDMHSLDSRHRDWLLEQNTQLTQGSAQPKRQEYQMHSSPYQLIDQPLYPANQQYHGDQSYDGYNAVVAHSAGVYHQPQTVNETGYDNSSSEQFNSESSRKLLNSKRSKYTSDYARFMLLLEKTKSKVSAEESGYYQGQRAGSPNQRSGSPSIQFMKSSEIYQRLKELKVGGKSSLRRSVSAPQSPVKKKHHLRGAWSEDYAILVRAPLPPAPSRNPAPKDFFQELMSRPTLQLATDF